VGGGVVRCGEWAGVWWGGAGVVARGGMAWRGWRWVARVAWGGAGGTSGVRCGWVGRVGWADVCWGRNGRWNGMRSVDVGALAALPYGKIFLDIQPAQNASVWQPQVMCWDCIVQVCPLRFGREGTSTAQDLGKKLDQMGLWLIHNTPHVAVSRVMIRRPCSIMHTLTAVLP